MKIAIELQPCCGSRSGIGLYTYEIAKRLKECESAVFQGNLFNFLGRHDSSGSLKGISMPVYEQKTIPYGIYRRLWDKIPISYKQLFPPTDVSLFCNFIVPPRITGITVTVVHDMTYLRYPETVDAKNMKRLQKGIDYSIERSAKIVTVSEFSKREIALLLGVPLNKIEVVYPSASTSGTVCDFDKLAMRLGIERPYVLFVGTVEPRKNLRRLLAAFEMLKNRTGLKHQLVLCGGKGWNNRGIYDQFKSMRYKADVISTGYLSDTERNTLYKMASAMVFPSVYEGFGVPPLEAMHWDVPVVCSNAASLPEVIGSAGHYIDPMSTESIADGLEKVLTDRDYAQVLVRRGQEQCRRFSWESSAQKMLKILIDCGDKGAVT